MVQAHVPADWSFHFLLLDQGHMVPDSTEEGTFCFANIETLTFTNHNVYDSNRLACNRKPWFKKTTIRKYNASSSIYKSTELTFMAGPTALFGFWWWFNASIMVTMHQSISKRMRGPKCDFWVGFKVFRDFVIPHKEIPIFLNTIPYLFLLARESGDYPNTRISFLGLHLMYKWRPILLFGFQVGPF